MNDCAGRGELLELGKKSKDSNGLKKAFMLQKEGKKKDGDKNSSKEEEDSGRWKAGIKARSGSFHKCINMSL